MNNRDCEEETTGDPIVDSDIAFQASVLYMLERYHAMTTLANTGSLTQRKLFNDAFEAYQRELGTYVERRIKDYLNHNPPTYK